MAINTDSMYPRRNSMQNSGPVKSRMPRRHSMISRPPRPSKSNSFNKTMASMMIDTYEADRVSEIMNNQPQQQGRRQRIRKSVSFDEVVMVRPVLPLQDYTDQEIISSWYLPIEKQRMKQEIMNIIKVVKKKNENSEKQFNVRGLEWLAAKDKSRERKRKASITEILNEQKAQREAHASQQRDDENDNDHFQQDNNKQCPPPIVYYDDKAFRKIYKRHSRVALQLAHTMGRIDEVEAGIKPREDFHNSISSMNSSDSGSLRSSRSMRSMSSRGSMHSTSQRSISTKGASSRRTRSGSRRFSLGASSSSAAAPKNGSKNASWDTIIGGTVSVA